MSQPPQWYFPPWLQTQQQLHFPAAVVGQSLQPLLKQGLTLDALQCCGHEHFAAPQVHFVVPPQTLPLQAALHAAHKVVDPKHVQYVHALLDAVHLHFGPPQPQQQIPTP